LAISKNLEEKMVKQNTLKTSLFQFFFDVFKIIHPIVKIYHQKKILIIILAKMDI